jgi:hypothetical protein
MCVGNGKKHGDKEEPCRVLQRVVPAHSFVEQPCVSQSYYSKDRRKAATLLFFSFRNCLFGRTLSDKSGVVVIDLAALQELPDAVQSNKCVDDGEDHRRQKRQGKPQQSEQR